jgi:hypothetical protein
MLHDRSCTHRHICINVAAYTDAVTSNELALDIVTNVPAVPTLMLSNSRMVDGEDSRHEGKGGGKAKERRCEHGGGWVVVVGNW